MKKLIFILLATMPYFVSSQIIINEHTQLKQDIMNVCTFLSKHPNAKSLTIETRLIKGNDSQCFSLKSEINKLTVSSTSISGLRYGLYEYLDQLGYEFYLPGKLWTYTPTAPSLNINSVYNICPSFTTRRFFATGGLPKGEQYENYRQEWNSWSRMNRFGGEALGGHSWNGFIKKHKDFLIKNPEYMAEVKGKRSKVKLNAKFCLSNPGLQKKYIDFMVNRLNKKMKSAPKMERYIMTVDPSDGGGHCSCNECTKQGSVSDRVFSLANLVAKEYQAIDKRAYVNLYAYNKHAYPTKVGLEHNVIVQVVPYAFTDYPNPSELIQKWTNIAEETYIYDYWGIPDWSFDLPLREEYFLKNIEKRIKEWESFNLKGFYVETSYSKFTNGLLLHYLSRRSWDKSQTSSRYIKEFSQKMFPSVPNQMEKLFNYILNERLPNTELLHNCANILLNAKQHKLSSKEQQRIQEIEFYLQYIFHYLKANSYKSSENVSNLLHIVEMSKSKNIIHFDRIEKLLKHRKFKNINIIEGKKINPSLIDIKNGSTIYSKDNGNQQVDLTKMKRDYEDIVMKTRINWFFNASDNQTIINLRHINSSKKFKFTLENLTTGKKVTWEDIITKKNKQIRLETIPDNEYRLYIKNSDWYFINFPKNILLWIYEMPSVHKIPYVHVTTGNKNLQIKNANTKHLLPVVYNQLKQPQTGKYIDEFGAYEFTNTTNQVLSIQNTSKTKYIVIDKKMYINPIRLK